MLNKNVLHAVAGSSFYRSAKVYHIKQYSKFCMEAGKESSLALRGSSSDNCIL